MRLTIKIYFLIIACFHIFISKAQDKINVEIFLTQTASYCGGVRPPEELLKKLRTPTSLKEKRIYIRKGKTNNPKAKDFIVVKSDSFGIVRLKLDTGIYYLVEEIKSNKKYYNEKLKKHKKASNSYAKIDHECLKLWITKPDFIFEVRPGTNKFSHNFHLPCERNSTPCVTFVGAMPQ